MCSNTHTLARTHISSLALSHTNRHTYPYAATALLFHYPGALLASCSAPAREVKCRRARPDCTVGGEGDGWLGGLLAVVVWGVRERVEALGWGLDEKQLPQDGGVWIFFFFFVCWGGVV